MTDKELEAKKKAFHAEMINLCAEIISESKRRAKERCLPTYNPGFFRRMVSTYGGYEAARKLIASDNLQTGFTQLFELDMLSYTVEAHILRPEWQDLFTDEERKRAADRLTDYGFTGGV